MSQKVLKKEFPMDLDDLVDVLLTALRTNGWNLSKMQYEVAALQAQQKLRLKNGEKAVAVSLELTAKWKDCGDGIELEIIVQDPVHEWTDKECAEQCLAIMAALPDEKSYDTLYSKQPDFIYDEFESNN
jgi:hypothetical protein